MPGIEGARGAQQRRHGLVCGGGPACGIEPRHGRQARDLGEQAGEQQPRAGDDRGGARERQRCLRDNAGAGKEGDRDDGDAAAARMEVGQVDRRRLGRGTVRRNDQHGAGRDDDAVDPPAKPGQADIGQIGPAGRERRHGRIMTGER